MPIRRPSSGRQSRDDARTGIAKANPARAMEERNDRDEPITDSRSWGSQIAASPNAWPCQAVMKPQDEKIKPETIEPPSILQWGARTAP